MATDPSFGNNLVGIDLGTQSIRVTTWPTMQVHTLPACVARVPNSDVLWPTYLAGDAAHQQAILNPAGTAWSVSRLFALAHDDAVATYEADRAPTGRCSNPRGDAWLHLGDHTLSPEEAMSHILRAAKTWAQDQGEHSVTSAVITVPHSFTGAQRRALTAAARMAGLQIQELLTAPVAAALAAVPTEDMPPPDEAVEAAENVGAPSNAQAHEDESENPASAQAAGKIVQAENPPSTQCILVVDFGAGSLDVGVLRVHDNEITVLAEGCDPLLGGNDCDEALVQALCTPFHSAHGIDLRHMPTAHERLRQAARNIREKLSVETSATLVLPHIAATLKGTLHLNRTISQSDLADCMDEHLARAVALCEQVLADAQIAARDVDAIWSLGGMAHTPAWHKALAKLHPNVVICADSALAQGALRRAAMRAGAADGPKINTPNQVRALPATAGNVRGLTRDEVDTIIERDNAIVTEVARRQAHQTLQARARALLASLAQSAEAAGAQTPGPTDLASDGASDDASEQTPPLFATMAAVHQALEHDITSAAGHEHLAHHLQNLDVAAAQWQRGQGHA